MTGQMTKKSAQGHQVQQQASGQRGHDTEVQEHHASANASVRLIPLYLFLHSSQGYVLILSTMSTFANPSSSCHHLSHLDDR